MKHPAHQQCLGQLNGLKVCFKLFRHERNLYPMKYQIINSSVLIIATIFFAQSMQSQDTLKTGKNYPAGVYFEYGFGSYAVKDQYISKEKYSGNMPQYTFGWAREHDKYVYKLKFAYRISDKIKNNNATTYITQVTLNQGFLYPLKPGRLFKKDLFFYLGPSTDFIYYFNEPYISVAGFDYSQSFAAMLSLGLNMDAIYKIAHKLQMESSLSLSVISFSFRAVDSDEDDQSPAKLLTLFKGLNLDFNFGVRYFILNELSVNLKYDFQLLTISAWDPLTSASDNGMIGLTYRF